MADTISGILRDKQDITNQLASTPDIIPVLKTFSQNFEFKPLVTKQTSITYSGTDVFILDNSDFGILDQNHLDGSGTETLYAVLPNNNQFEEYFSQDLYIDTTNSTGTLDSTNETYTLTTGQILQSEVIAKLREPIINAKITEFTEENARIYFSNDGGSNWYEASSESTILTFPSNSTGDELKYKIEATQDFTISDPIKIQINL